MERIKCALLGFGYWGKIMKKYIDADPRLELRYILDRNLDPLLKKEEIHDVDAVFICLPTALHYEFAKYFIQKKVNVFCEKPLTLSYLETEELITLAEKKEVVLYADYPFLFSPSIEFIKNNITSLGKVNFVKFNFEQFGAFYPKEDVLDTIAPHPLSILFHLFPQMKYRLAVDRAVVLNKIEDKILSCVVDFRLGGLSGNVEMSLLSATKQRNFFIYCENGCLIFNMLDCFTVKILKYNLKHKNFEEIGRVFSESNNLAFSLEDFIFQLDSPSDANSTLTLAISSATEEMRKVLLRNFETEKKA